MPSKRLIALSTAIIANARVADTLGDIDQMSCEQVVWYSVVASVL